MAPRACFAVTFRGMKPNNGCFVELTIVLGLEVHVQVQGEPDAGNMMSRDRVFAFSSPSLLP